jgi:translation initiation factor 3 subunit E
VYIFLEGTKVYKKADMQQAIVQVLSVTHMAEYESDYRNKLSGKKGIDKDVQKRYEEFQKIHAQQAKRATAIVQLIDSADYAEMRKLKTMEEICEKHNLESDFPDALFEWAKINFEMGQYETSNNILKHYILMVTNIEPEKQDPARLVQAYWGTLAGMILHGDTDDCVQIVGKLDEHLETAVATNKQPKENIIAQKAYLLHWILFIVFKTPARNLKVRRQLVDFFLEDRNLHVVSIACPHLLRYVAALCVIEHRAQDVLPRLTSESFWYSDPVTKFLVSLYKDADFDKAQEYVVEIGKLVKVDFFLHDAEDFQEICRMLIFETFCRIHVHIDLKMIAEKLDMTVDDAEVWIVKLIQNAKLDAKIDSELNRVTMTRDSQSIYQEVLDKTKNIAFRSLQLNNHIEKRLMPQYQQSQGAY